MKMSRAQSKHRREMKRAAHRKGLRIHMANERVHTQRVIAKQIEEAIAKQQSQKSEGKAL